MKNPETMTVTFGRNTPYTAYEFTGAWIQNTFPSIWEGSYTFPSSFSPEDYDGINTIRIETEDKDSNLLDGNPGSVVGIISGERKNYEDENGIDNNKRIIL